MRPQSIYDGRLSICSTALDRCAAPAPSASRAFRSKTVSTASSVSSGTINCIVYTMPANTKSTMPSAVLFFGSSAIASAQDCCAYGSDAPKYDCQMLLSFTAEGGGAAAPASAAALGAGLSL